MQALTEATPSCCIWVTMDRVRLFTPVPHETEHAFQFVHADTTQFTGHPTSAHDRSSTSGDGQASPPNVAAVVTERTCDWTPVPQLLLHFVHADHSETVQCTGHAAGSHILTFPKTGQATPPCCIGVVMIRLRLCAPIPQVTVHVLHSSHSDTTQSTGQGESEHERSSVSNGQTLPPCANCVIMLRLRLCAPVPQVRVQSLHAVQGDVVQCTGHLPSEHDCVSSVVGQALPP